jgi:hypothetical protein
LINFWLIGQMVLPPLQRLLRLVTKGKLEVMMQPHSWLLSLLVMDLKKEKEMM